MVSHGAAITSQDGAGRSDSALNIMAGHTRSCFISIKAFVERPYWVNALYEYPIITFPNAPIVSLKSGLKMERLPAVMCMMPELLKSGPTGQKIISGHQ